LAFKAYHSYVEIITRGKDRVEKSGEVAVGIDDDSTVLRTSAEAIRLLCRYGSRQEAEKALDIGHDIGKWLEQAEHIKTASDAGSVGTTQPSVEPTALALAYYAMGVSQAHWARLTYEVEARASIQAKAVHYLRKSLSPELGDTNNTDALYALALVLAETRDILGAIKVVKRALSSTTSNKTTISTDGVLSGGLASEYGRERKLIPLWHLLALLLTSRSEFAAAEKACEAAFEQFGDSTVLFGAIDAEPFRSEHLTQINGGTTLDLGLVDRLEDFEKSCILQIKMTQLALTEMADGAIAAVDGCDELLALYSRLFGDPAGQRPKPIPPTTAMPPPKSAMGTIRGSIFRGRGSVRNSQKEIPTRNPSIISSDASTLPTQPGAPAIQVTEENGSAHANGHHRHHLFHHHKHDDNNGSVKRSSSKLHKRSSASIHKQSMDEADRTPEVPPLPANTLHSTPAQTGIIHSEPPRRSPSNHQGQSGESNARALHPVPHNMAHESPPVDHGEQPPKQDVRLPGPPPHAHYKSSDPRFSRLQERRQKVSLLVDIWIFISTLYTQAQMYDDAQEAVAEARRLAETFEAEISQESSTAKAFGEKGWGGGKSVEELWADAYAAVSTHRPRNSNNVLTVSQHGELLVAQSFKHQARSDFERALQHFPDHPQSIVGLSNILMDIYCEVIPLEPTKQTGVVTPVSQPSLPSVQKDTQPNTKTQHLTSHIPSAENQLSPPELNRLAARDRAFGLLSTLTKLGSGWDYSEAWYALARAYEESGQIDKTKEVLWWCVELEDTRPVRSWRDVAKGGFVL
jgi:tetratricopeptide (TPR) repeat protein